ncbi:MAG: hypothetical protein J2P19_25690, partial [Pseudonocardia sp.]|nr:hypothetical protein [Pseudonocardia sp.]
MDLDEAGGALYALPRDEFTRARDDLAKRARADGDRDLAAAIGRLRRPTVSAWLINQLARQRPERLEELAELGEALRDAHARLDGTRLRRLSVRRRELVATLARLTRELAEQAGASVSETVGRELEDMLATALTSRGASRVLASGLLSSAKELADAGADAEPGGLSDPAVAGQRWPSVEPDARPRTAPAGPAAEPATPTEPTERPEAPATREPSPALVRARQDLDRTESAVAKAEHRQAAAHRAYEQAAADETAAHKAVA